MPEGHTGQEIKLLFLLHATWNRIKGSEPHWVRGPGTRARQEPGHHCPLIKPSATGCWPWLGLVLGTENTIDAILDPCSSWPWTGDALGLGPPSELLHPVQLCPLFLVSPITWSIPSLSHLPHPQETILKELQGYHLYRVL